MPAPIAKGIILSISLIVAAGAAVYENPQVKQWVDENRRKVAVALHSLGDELAPAPERRQSDDASRREDSSPEAVERRRRARDEIFERGILLEERKRAERRSTRRAQGRGMSFDDLVEKDGSLRQDRFATGVSSTDYATVEYGGSAITGIEYGGLRHRRIEPQDALTPPPSSPIATEPIDSHNIQASDQPCSPAPPHPASPPLPPKPEAYLPPRTLASTDETNSRSSTQLVDLTPTTIESSSAADHLNELSQVSSQQQQQQQQHDAEMYMSVDEWAHNQSTQQSFHSPAHSLSRSSTPTLDNASVAESIEHASQAGTEDMDIMSDFGEGINTPSTWTEVGSQISDD